MAGASVYIAMVGGGGTDVWRWSSRLGNRVSLMWAAYGRIVVVSLTQNSRLHRDAARMALSRPSRHFKAGASERSPPLWPGINAALTLQGDADRFTREARAGKGV